MDIKRQLEREHSKAGMIKIINYIGADRDRFASLITIFLQGPYRITQRAAWPLSYCVEAHPALVKPYLKLLLDFLLTPALPDAVKRNTMRLLQFIDIPSRYHGRVINFCMEYLQNRKTPIAVKVFSMTVLGNLCEDYPEMKNELILIIEDQLAYASPAFTSRARKVLKALKALDAQV